MGTIQEAVTCGRLNHFNRRQETGSTPRRCVCKVTVPFPQQRESWKWIEATTVPLAGGKSGHCGDGPTAKGGWASVVEAQGERAGVNQGLVPAVDGRVLVARDGPDFVEGGLISQVDGEQLRLERTDT